MSRTAKIEWSLRTWNPMTGCDKVSPGCDNCYARRMAYRLWAMGQPKYKNGFKLTIHEDVLTEPFSWSKPQIVFVNSMSDLFHKDVPYQFIEDIFEVMRQCDQHIFQILTKRSKNLKRLSPKIDWPTNVWMGVTVESDDYKYRIDDLRSTGAAVKFLSCEPLLAPIYDMNLKGIDWVIVGGESGPRARSMDEKWVWDIKAQCKAQNSHFFFKQWGGVNKKKAGRLLRGKTYDAMPELPELHYSLGL
ncbi:DUF5131 family protein [Candidatus Zixiibacteriota bacterium]